MTPRGGGRGHKYGAMPRDAAGLTREQTEALGLKFTKFYDSTKERDRHWTLKEKQAQGDISGLQWQPRFPIEVNGVKVCVYVADAVYVENGEVVVEDVKGGSVRTPAYVLKRKLMLAVHGVKIRET
jgi:hypothetical protein